MRSSGPQLPEFRKKELLKATDREDYYNRWIFWVHFGEAQSAYDVSIIFSL